MALQRTMLLVWEFPWLASELGVLGSWRAALSTSWCVSVAAWGGGGGVRVPVAEEAPASSVRGEVALLCSSHACLLPSASHLVCNYVCKKTPALEIRSPLQQLLHLDVSLACPFLSVLISSSSRSV